MTAQTIGLALLALLAAFFLANLVTAYRTQGGAIGQVPVMAFAVFIPAIAAFELVLIDRTAGWPGWPLWGYLALWLVTTPLAWWATDWAGKLGSRKASSTDAARGKPADDRDLP